MSAKTVDLREAQANLKDLLSLVAQGTEIVLTDGTTRSFSHESEATKAGKHYLLGGKC
jgi:hypothetical protein